MRHFRGWLGYKDIFINLAMFNVYFLQKAAIGGGGLFSAGLSPGESVNWAMSP